MAMALKGQGRGSQVFNLPLHSPADMVKLKVDPVGKVRRGKSWARWSYDESYILSHWSVRGNFVSIE